MLAKRHPASVFFVFSMLLLAHPGCNQNKTKPVESEKSAAKSGHEKMVEQLAIQGNEVQENKYFGDREYQELKKMAARPMTGIQSVAVPTQLGRLSIHLGKEDEAIASFQTAYNRLEGGAFQAPPAQQQAMKYSLAFQLGMAYLRRAETENCCQQNSPDSCVVPIRGQGIHTRQDSSRQAIRYFQQAYQTALPGTPEKARAKWLLNIACMTIGAYPRLLGQEQLIPETFFESQVPFPEFKNRSKQLGLDVFGCAGGAIADDFDNDLDIDVVVSDYDPNGQIRMFRNDREKGFVDVTEQSNLKGILGGLNLNQADYNNDGFVDIFVMRGGWFENQGRIPNSLLRNNGDGTFTDVTFEAGLATDNYPTQASGWADYDLDGDLDLLIGNEPYGKPAPLQLFRNNGDGTFTDVAKDAGVDAKVFSKAVVWGDFNNDRYPDFYVSNLQGDNRLYQNNGNGRFTERAKQLGVTRPQSSFPCWFWILITTEILTCSSPVSQPRLPNWRTMPNMEKSPARPIVFIKTGGIDLLTCLVS